MTEKMKVTRREMIVAAASVIPAMALPAATLPAAALSSTTVLPEWEWTVKFPEIWKTNLFYVESYKSGLIQVKWREKYLYWHPIGHGSKFWHFEGRDGRFAAEISARTSGPNLEIDYISVTEESGGTLKQSSIGAIGNYCAAIVTASRSLSVLEPLNCDD